jgi:hypothetical protein
MTGLHRALTLATCLCAAGCSADGEGTIVFRVSGEDGAREGFPNDEASFADGWSLQFDKYLVAVAGIEIDASDAGAAATDERVYVVDLHAGEPELDEIGPVAARRWDRVSWAMRAPEADDDVVAVDGVSDEDVARLIDGGFVYWVSGRATKDAREVTFAWGLDNPSRNRDCTNGVDGTAGLVVRNNTVTEAEITVHVEHLFWDTLGSEQQVLRFEPIAAVADDAGAVQWDGLAEQRLADMQDSDGEPLLDDDGTAVVYNPGSLPISNLQEFILAATRTQAHLGGEGLCTIEPP